MSGQKTHQNETRRDVGSERAHHAIAGQHWSKFIYFIHFSFSDFPPAFSVKNTHTSLLYKQLASSSSTSSFSFSSSSFVPLLASKHFLLLETIQHSSLFPLSLVSFSLFYISLFFFFFALQLQLGIISMFLLPSCISLFFLYLFTFFLIILLLFFLLFLRRSQVEGLCSRLNLVLGCRSIKSSSRGSFAEYSWEEEEAVGRWNRLEWNRVVWLSARQMTPTLLPLVPSSSSTSCV